MLRHKYKDRQECLLAKNLIVAGHVTDALDGKGESLLTTSLKTAAMVNIMHCNGWTYSQVRSYMLKHVLCVLACSVGAACLGPVQWWEGCSVCTRHTTEFQRRRKGGGVRRVRRCVQHRKGTRSECHLRGRGTLSVAGLIVGVIVSYVIHWVTMKRLKYRILGPLSFLADIALS